MVYFFGRLETPWATYRARCFSIYRVQTPPMRDDDVGRHVCRAATLTTHGVGNATQ